MLANNDSAEVTGYLRDALERTLAFIWAPVANHGIPAQTQVFLGDLGGGSSLGYAVNSAGQVVGNSSLARNKGQRAFVWDNSFANPKLRNLNDLTPIKAGISYFRDARTITESGKILAEGIGKGGNTRSCVLVPNG